MPSNSRRLNLNGSTSKDQGKKKLPLLERQQRARQALMPLLDQLNERFIEAEKRLKAMRPARDASAISHYEPIDPAHPDGYDINHHIGLVKYQGEWRLCHGLEYENDPNRDIIWKPITDISAQLRVTVAQKFEKTFRILQERIVSSTESFLPVIEDAIAKMDLALADKGGK